mmetsp:Transcript_33374/g.92149  ORF Transcript_33374/g.92149 Transcript_33374/m.92149 type:complete len:214 (+) Transcript_33374:779-1420(+)
MRGTSLAACNFRSYALRFRTSLPPSRSHTHGRRVTEPAPLELAAREMSANQNFRRSEMDSVNTVPSRSTQPSSVGSKPSRSRSSPAALAKRFQTLCIGSSSTTNAASPPSSLICSAKAIAAFMATMFAPGVGASATKMTHLSQQPCACKVARISSAIACVGQAQMLTDGLSPTFVANKSGQRWALSFAMSVPWMSIVWPQPIGTAKSTPRTPV